MRYGPDKHHRRSIRLHGYDYTQAGAYFVTVTTRDKQCLFGDVVEEEIRLSEFGKVVWKSWHEIPEHLSGVRMDEFVVMPNHVHGILLIPDNRRGTACRAPTPERFGRPVSGSLPTIVRSFKSVSTKRINRIRSTPGTPVWQRNYYERVIRSEAELDRVRQYIVYNPAKWPEDAENPQTVGPSTQQ